jgi:hypothetical protein
VVEREEPQTAGEPGNPLGSPAAYFLPARHATLRQGDIILAPTVTVWSAESKTALALGSEGAEPAPLLSLWQAGEDPETAPDPLAPPPVTLEAVYRPVMVLSHECEIEKEFNEYVAPFEKHGEAAVARAIDDADARWDLDRYVLVAPLLEYHPAEVAPDKWPAIEAARKVGYFPVLPLPGASPPAPSFVHLSRVTTVERRLLSYARKLASLTPAAVHLLRIKFAETHSVRTLSILSKLEAALGRTIMDVRILKQGRATSTVGLVLDHGAMLTVDVKTDPKTVRPQRTRRPRP